MGIYLRLVHKAHVSVTRPATKHKTCNNTQKQNTKQTRQKQYDRKKYEGKSHKP